MRTLKRPDSSSLIPPSEPEQLAALARDHGRIGRIAVTAPKPACRSCGSQATIYVAMSKGCVCFPQDADQVLCPQHDLQSEPLGTWEARKLLPVIA